MVASGKSKFLSARHWATRGEVDIENFFNLLDSIISRLLLSPLLCKNAILFSQDQDFAAQIDTILLILNFKVIDLLDVLLD